AAARSDPERAARAGSWSSRSPRSCGVVASHSLASGAGRARSRRMRRGLSLLVALLGISCGSAAHVPATQSPGQETAEWMRSHYLSGRETRDALVRGDLEDARARFQRLSREPGPSDAPPSWEP